MTQHDLYRRSTMGLMENGVNQGRTNYEREEKEDDRMSILQPY
jgi:hypothetical protein